MRALLDTHAFLWWNSDDAQLSAPARAFIADGRNELYVSAASAWEIADGEVWGEGNLVGRTPGEGP